MSQVARLLHFPLGSLQPLLWRMVVAALLAAAVLISSPGTSSAAITASVLNQGGIAGDAYSYATGSFTTTPNTLILAWITTNKDADLRDPVIGGMNALNWQKVNSVDWGSGGNRTTLWKTMVSVTETTSLTISFGGFKQRGCSWSILQFSRVATWGVNGSAAVVQSATATGGGSEGAIFTIPLANGLSFPGNGAAGGFAFDTVGSTAPSARDGYTAAPLITHGAPATSMLTEWKVPGNTPPSVTQGSVSNFGGIAVEIGACSSTYLDTGSDPGNASLIPGGPATFVDSFTFQTLRGTNLVTDVTVTLSTGSYTGISVIEITDDTGATVYGSLSNPQSNTPKVPLTTTNITATTTVTGYKIRITPKSHVDMPAPQGTFYNVTAYISDWTDTNDHVGSDSGGTTVTIDNRSPDNVAVPAASPWDAENNLSWSNPADADLATVLVLHRAGGAVADVPTEGLSYSLGATIGNSTVGCVVAKPGTSCTDSGLTNNVTYYYKIFTRDENGNWSTGAATPQPATPQHYQPDAMIKLTSDGTFLSNDSYETTASSQSKSQQLSTGKIATYDLRFQNDGSTTDNLVITGTGSGSNFTVQYLDEGGVDRTAAVTPPGTGYTISGVAVAGFRDWTLNVKPNGGVTPVAGGTSYTVFATATSANRSISVDQVKAVTTSSSANITLVKSSDKTTCIPGEEITYSTVASNPASLSAASSVAVIDTIPANTGFKIDGAEFDPGTSGQTCTITFTNTYPNGTFTYTPISGGCGAPAGYDFCVKQVKWSLPAMPAGTNFTVSTTVRVK